jgi:N-sulfoglucosamine sulfohydrolase
MRIVALALLGILSSCAAPGAGSGPRRPNLLWITAEDLSPQLGCYGDAAARTPHLDRLAAEGVRYTKAFATAPVCSPARSTLITGLYATSMGTQRLRSAFPLPPGVRGFPALLRESGYYCTNNVKTDYNVADEEALIRDCWDENSPKAHWRSRPPGRPFFAVFNDMTTHQSRMSAWPEEEFRREVQSRLAPREIADPAAVPLPPYYPDTPVVRRAVARAYDCIRVMDRNVGRILRELEDDGLAEDTIVFYFSDHGSGLPRHKRMLHDSGLRVPLIVRFPERHRAQAPAAPGSSVDDLVSFVDFAPTMLALAGLERPKAMQGRPFLGSGPRAGLTYVFGARDRVDEAYDVARSVRDGRFLYIRNFMPQLSAHQPGAYSDQAEICRELRRLAAAGALTGAARDFAAPTRPLEELYDAERDPFQVENLARRPEQRERVERMRGVLESWIHATGDTGLLPESEAWTRGPLLGAPIPRGRLLGAASLVGTQDVAPMLRTMKDPDPAVRAWGAMALGVLDQPPEAAHAALLAAVQDASPALRIEAAAALARHGEEARALPVLQAELGGTDLTVVLHAARTLELLGEAARPLRGEVEALAARVKDAPGDLAMFVRFSTGALLERLAR